MKKMIIGIMLVLSMAATVITGCGKEEKISSEEMKYRLPHNKELSFTTQEKQIVEKDGLVPADKENSYKGVNETIKIDGIEGQLFYDFDADGTFNSYTWIGIADDYKGAVDELYEYFMPVYGDGKKITDDVAVLAGDVGYYWSVTNNDVPYRVMVYYCEQLNTDNNYIWFKILKEE